MWEVEGVKLKAECFRPFVPAEVLYDFDGPRTFTFRDANQELYLAHWADEDAMVARFLVAVFSDELLSRLRRGEISVREGLDQPRVFVVHIGAQTEVQNVWSVRFRDLPADVLPRPATMLLPSLEPIATIRAIGDKVQPGADSALRRP